jgi:hypothetical protein
MMNICLPADRIEFVQESIQCQEARRLLSPPRKPRSSIGFYDDPPLEAVIVVEEEEDQGDFSERLEDATEKLRKASLSLRSMDSMSDLLSMSSFASWTSRSWSWTSGSGEGEVDESDDESTVVLGNEIDNVGEKDSVSPSNSQGSVATNDSDWKHSCEKILASIDTEHGRIVMASWRRFCSEQGNNTNQDDFLEFLGEQIILRILQLDPRSRAVVGISSFRSPRYGKMCILLGNTVHRLVQLLDQRESPSKNHLELRSISISLRREGFDLRLVEDALLYGVESGVSPSSWTAGIEEAWENTIPLFLQAMRTLTISD